MIETVSNAGIVGKLSMVVVFAPMIMGIVYAIRPTEARLALMRPLSLAAIFSGLVGLCVGLINVLIGISSSEAPNRVMYIGLAESLVPPVLSFGCLTAAWLCVALGLRRQAP